MSPGKGPGRWMQLYKSLQPHQVSSWSPTGAGLSHPAACSASVTPAVLQPMPAGLCCPAWLLPWQAPQRMYAGVQISAAPPGEQLKPHRRRRGPVSPWRNRAACPALVAPAVLQPMLAALCCLAWVLRDFHAHQSACTLPRQPLIAEGS